MSPAMQTWKTKVQRMPATRASFEKWLFVHISGVLFGKKTGELLVLKEGECRLNLEQQLKIIEVLASIWNYSHMVLLRDLSCARIVFYNHAGVQDVLSKIPAWVFNTIGYPTPVKPETFLSEVGVRWKKTGSIPHEIGFALGYPVKDVLGFMGLIPLPCTGMCGWRIHGNPRLSLQKSREFKAAKEQALAFIEM